MPLETASYISQLVATNPTASDPKSQGDNHLRMIKTVLQTQFPNFGTAAVNATVAEVNYLVGVTSGIQGQLNLKAPINSPTFTGTVTIPAGAAIADLANYAPVNSPALTGTPTAPTAAAGTSTTQIASTAFVQATAFSAALPSQTGNTGKFVTTDGTNASWAEAVTPSGSQTLTNKTLSSALLVGTLTEDVYSIADGASVDIDPANGSIQTWTLGASRSPTATSFGAGQAVILMVTAGANSITWPSVTWSKVGGGGTAPTLTSSGATCVVLWKVGSTLYGSLLGSV